MFYGLLIVIVFCFVYEDLKINILYIVAFYGLFILEYGVLINC